MGDQAQRRLMRGVDDLDFYIGDEAIDKPSYATKVRGGRPTPKLVLGRTDRLMSVTFCCAVAHPSWHHRGLGPNGEVHGAGHLQVSAGRA